MKIWVWIHGNFMGDSFNEWDMWRWSMIVAISVIVSN